MIVLISRTYIFLRAGMPRTLVALGLAAALAGCGSATTGSGQAAAGASAGGAPVASGGGGAFDAQVAERPAGSAAAGTVIQQGRQRISQGSQASITTTAQHVSAPGGAAAGSLSSDPSLSVTRPGASRPAAGRRGRRPPARAVPPATSSPPSTIAINTQPPQANPPTRTVQRTVTVTDTRTVVHTVTVSKSVRPDVPSTAFLPSTHPALAQTSFTVAGGNIGCAIATDAVRCELVHRVWAPPPVPARCRSGWGDTIALRARGPASFACGGRSPLAPDAKVIPDGWDDRIGGMTCQVRGIGVDCFSARHHGFMISRTGYALY